MHKVKKLIDIDYQYNGNLFYSKNWIRVLIDEYNFDIKTVVHQEQPDDPILVFAELEDIFGKRIISLPFSDYTEPIIASESELYNVLNFLKEFYCNHTIIVKYHGTMDESQICGFENIRQAVCHRIDLDKNIELIWQSTNRAFKKGVKKAQSHDLFVNRYNVSDGINIFHQMLTDLRRKKLNILPQPKSFYMRMFYHFIRKEQGNLWVTYLKDKPIAAAILLHSGDAMFDKMGVSDSNYLEFRPNNILLWEIMKYGQSNNFRYLDMGLTPTANEGLMRFKKSLGASKTDINYYRYVPDDYDFQKEDYIKQMLSGVTSLLVKPEIPENIVHEAGELLYRYFA